MDRQRLLENHTVEELADTVLKLQGEVKELNNENYLLNSKIKDLINGEREIMYLVDEQSADIKEYNILGKIGEGTYFANGTGVKIDDLRSFLKYKSEHKEHDSKFTDEIRELKNEIEELKKRNDELNEWCQKYKWRAEEYRVAILPRATEKAKKAIDEREFLSIRIEEIEEIKAKNEKIKELCDENMQLQLKRNELRQTVDDLQEKISELESELSVKENLLKVKNGLCGEKSDYETLMEEILSYEQTNNEDDVRLFNYQALRNFYENQHRAKRKLHIHIIGLREFGGEQYMRYSDVQELIKELES